ncbi:MAG: helix-turn-helix domain-containing protein [Clostridia bacterium]|nr:helix-turn-helix domain-containing protein [Clostridia bacterium]
MDIFFEQYNRDFYICAGTNLNYPSHFQSEVELMYIASGKMDVTEGGKCYTLSSGDIFIVFPNREHSYKSDHENKHIMLIFDPEWCGLSRDVFTNYIPDCPIIRSNDAPPLWSRILKEIVSEYRSNLDSRIEICRSYTLVIALQLLRFMDFKNTSFVDLPLVNSIVAYCLNNYQQKITLDDLSKAVGVNKYHVSRVFSQRLGTTFVEYINSLRINAAASRLIKTRDSITKIANECGFNSSRTFTRVFSKKMGLPPNKYRIANRVFGQQQQ